MKKDWNVCFGLDLQAQVHPYKKAIVTDQSSISYLELQTLSNKAAQALQRKKIKPGDTILVFMPNSIDYAVIFFAAVRLGLNIVLANALYRDSELRPLIEATHPKCGFVPDDAAEALIHLADKNLDIVSVPPLIKTLRESPAKKRSLFPAPQSPEKATICIATSGSTGKPKIVSNSYLSEFANASLYIGRLLVKSKDVILTALPATQRFGLAAMLGSCIRGATVVLLPRFRAAQVLTLIEEHHVSVQYGVPTMFLKEIDAFLEAKKPPDISSLRTGVVAGANCSEKIFQFFEDQCECRLLNCYGTSEIGGLTMVKYNDSEDVRYHSCGQIFEGAAVKITDAKGQILPAGQTGEIICSVPWIMKGYVGAPERTARRFNAQGDFLTGDMGRMDDDGHLYIIGRKADLIIRGGYNIFPTELEQAFANLPDVSETCVMGCADSLLGERIFAVVKLKSEASDAADEKQVRRLLAKHIAKYKLPDHILFVDRIPKLPNGKVDYPSLKAFLKEQGFGAANDCR